LSEKPAPLTVTPEITRSAVPLFVTASVLVLLFPTTTLPNASEVAERLIAGVGVVTPVPVKETTLGEPVALLATVALPVTVPGVCGLNITLAVKLVPAAMVRGNEIELMLKAAPVTVTAETTRSALPVLLTTTVLVLLVPTVTLPNERLDGFTLTEIVV
jgi:multidrug transporter EmrE-like cation transporter